MRKNEAAEIASRVGAGLRRPNDQRGLAGLLPKRPGVALDDALLLPIGDIHQNSYQARQVFAPESMDSLIASVREEGVLEPILVRPLIEGFEIVFGERRTRAVRALNNEEPDNSRWQSIPAIVRNLDDAEAALITATENIVREDLTITDEAAMYEKLVAVWDLRPSRSSREIARRLGISHHRVARARRIGAHPTLAAQVDEGTITLRQALATLKGADLSDEDDGDPELDRADMDFVGSLSHGATNSAVDVDNVASEEDEPSNSATSTIPTQETNKSLSHGATNSRANTGGSTAQFLRPLHLAYRNASRLTEKVKPEDLKRLPASQRPGLIRTVDEAMRQLAEFRVMLETAGVDEGFESDVAAN